MINEFKGKTFVSVTVANDAGSVDFRMSDGSGFIMGHHQDCCESMTVEVAGDISDLINHEIIMAEEVSSTDHPAPPNAESYTWTFYKFGTVKGYVTLRFLGESNGYYSESVDIDRVPPSYSLIQ